MGGLSSSSLRSIAVGWLICGSCWGQARPSSALAALRRDARWSLTQAPTTFLTTTTTTTTTRLMATTKIRGGATSDVTAVDACPDSDAMLALRVGVSAVTETAGLWLVLWGTERLARMIHARSMAAGVTTTATTRVENGLLSRFGRFLTRPLAGLPLVQWLGQLVVVFASSAVKTVLDGGIRSAATRQVVQPNVVPGDGRWYASLRKPWFNPPGWVFPIMWLLISKPTQLWAIGRLLKRSSTAAASGATSSKDGTWPTLAVYCAHLALGDAWNTVFFGCQRIRLGAIVIATFWSLLATTTALFHRLDPVAGYLLLPTLGWVTVASGLNLEIYRLNSNTPGSA